MSPELALLQAITEQHQCAPRWSVEKEAYVNEEPWWNAHRPVYASGWTIIFVPPVLAVLLVMVIA